MKKPRLAAQLEKTASRVFHRTRGIITRDFQYEQICLMESTYGSAAVVNDFETWAETADPGTRYPVSEYLKIVDDRLGQKASEDNDADISEVTTAVYELVSDIPTRGEVKALLAKHPVEDIIFAFGDFVGGLDADQSKSAIKKFFRDGGADVIISKLKG